MMRLPYLQDGPRTSLSAARMLWLDELASPVGRLVAGVTERGVALLHLAGNERACQHLARLALTHDMAHRPGHPVMERLRQELAEWFEGRRQGFDIAVTSLDATPFQAMVWAAVSRIPFGETCTYGEIARRIGRPRAVRAVASAVAANPVLFIVPCHRVVAADGRLGGYAGGSRMKRRLLEMEQRR